KGTPGDVIGTTGQYRVASVPKGQLQVGALVDPAALKGRVAVGDIYPGQQLTTAQFAYAAPGTISTKLSGTDRAINITMDSERGMIGTIATGDRVDVFVGLNSEGVGGPVIKLLLSNVLVLRAPLAGSSGSYTLRVPEKQAAQLAYAADNGKLWFVARPASGAK